MIPLLAEVPEHYLGADKIVETDAGGVRALAAELRLGRDDVAFARAAFEWVRDEVAHSYDAADPRVTLAATEVLRERVGLCFAKSHLLAALLRSEGIPTGLCYQRLGNGDGFALHGLVAVHLGGWHRLDPRGNKSGVDAQFSLDGERLAWTVDPVVGEVDYPQVFATPAPVVVAALRASDDALALCERRLPSAL